jgi:hypothetical protein
MTTDANLSSGAGAGAGALGGGAAVAVATTGGGGGGTGMGDGGGAAGGVVPHATTRVSKATVIERIALMLDGERRVRQRVVGAENSRANTPCARSLRTNGLTGR